MERSGRQHGVARHGECHLGSAWSKTSCTRGSHLHGNREIHRLAARLVRPPVRIGKAECPNPMMHGRWSRTRPSTGEPPNKAAFVAAEAWREGRGQGQAVRAARTRPRAGKRIPGMDRIRCAARRDKVRLRRSCTSERRPAALCVSPAERRAPGVDGITWHGTSDLEATSSICRTRTAAPTASRPGAVHPQARAGNAARHRRAGGQDRPARGGGGAERHLRDGLPRLLLRLPAAQPAPALDALVSIYRRVNWILDADIRRSSTA